MNVSKLENLADITLKSIVAVNNLTDIASRPPQSPRFRRDRFILERRAGD